MASPADPLYRNPELKFAAEFAPTGIPIRVLSNRSEIAGLLEDAVGFWKDFPVAPEWRDANPLVVRLVCHEGQAGLVEPIYRMPKEHLLLIALGESVALADRSAGEATAYVTRALLEDQNAFRYQLLQAVLVFLLTPRDRLPLHASAVVKGQKVLLLSGPSGAGKTTLALAAARAGYQVLADDAVYVQRNPVFQIWGLSPYARLQSSALQAFPGAEQMIVGRTQDSRGKVLLDLRRQGYWSWPPAACRAALCAVARTGTAPSLKRISLEELAEQILDTLPTGFDLFGEELRELLFEWPERYGWQLSVPADGGDVLPLIEEMFEQIAEP